PRAGGFEQREAAVDVGADRRGGVPDRAIDMGLRGEVHDRARAVPGQQSIDQPAVADVAVHEEMARIALEQAQVAQVARVGQRVEVQHRLVATGEPVEDEVAADEAGAAGDEDHDAERLPLRSTTIRRAPDPMTAPSSPATAARVVLWGWHSEDAVAAVRQVCARGRCVTVAWFGNAADCTHGLDPFIHQFRLDPLPPRLDADPGRLAPQELLTFFDMYS